MKFKENEEESIVETPPIKEDASDTSKEFLFRTIKQNIALAAEMLEFSLSCLDKWCSCHEGDDKSEVSSKD